MCEEMLGALLSRLPVAPGPSSGSPPAVPPAVPPASQGAK